MKTPLSISKFWFLLFVLFGTTAPAQTIKGLLQDANSQPVAFATVALLNAPDSSLAKAGLANEKGFFEFSSIKAGTFLVQASAVGYQKTYSAAFVVGSNNVENLNLTLAQIAQNLAEVKVVAQKPLIEVLPDKMVFNVESSINAAGSNALELLQKSPSVVVDQNDNITLQGRNGVMVYIDGKPSPLTLQDLAIYLRSLPSDQVEAIEVITKPSAKYDAAGNAGIINIRLKKNKNFGTNGSFTLGAARGQYFPKFNGSLTLNHRTARANWFGTYSHRNAKDWSFINFNRQQVGTRFDQRSTTDSRSASHNLKTGADFFLNKKHTLGFLINANANDRSSLSSGRTLIGPVGQTTNSILVANNRSQGNRFNANANLNYRYADSTGHELNIDADYGRFDANGTQFQPNRYFNAAENQVLSERNYRMNTLTDIELATLKADYEQPFWGGKLGAGFKLSQVRTNNDFDFFDVIDSRDLLNSNRTNRFLYRENVNAAYVSFGRKVKKIGYQAGLRLEQTQSEGRLSSQTTQADANVKRSYLNLFPSAGLTYEHNAKNSFALNYSRRIDRPTYQDLNPFESKLDELSYAKGNAFLRPEYANSIEVSHTYNYTLTTSLSYSHTTDVVAQLTDTIEINRNFISPRNIASNDVVSLNVSYPFAAAKWWNVYLSGGLYHTRYRADFGINRVINLNATAYNFYGQNTFTLSPKLTLEVSGFYSSPSIWGGTYVTRAIGNLDLGLQSKVLQGKGSLKLTLSDVFFTQPWRGSNEFGELRIVASGGYESRQVRLNFSYNFGNKQVKAARQRKTGAEDEKGRIGG
ncbi:MAG: TonB-dependent receptor [Runella slithyformis]|nr:MAG: TonB-dependent receptor [Runella slithyformis]TAG84830.1 MAG: TonB-dependent receptor [Cytophagales bacterium]